MTNNKYFVYMTENIINNKYYIGVRKINHISDSSYLGSGVILSKAIDKYGKENFIRTIIGTYENQEQAYFMEQLLVNEDVVTDKNSYNLALGGEKPTLIKHTKEALKKMSEIHSGKNHHYYGVTGEDHPRYGTTLTNDHKNKISKSKKGKYLKENACNKRSVLQINKDNEIIKEFPTLSSAADSLNIHVSGIQKVCSGVNNTAGGYNWKYKEENK